MKKLLLACAVLLMAGGLAACNGDPIQSDPLFTAPPDDIYAAAQQGNTQRAWELIQAGEWDYGAADGRGKFPLDYAVEGGHADIVRMMLQYGANPNHMNTEGKTMLQVAQERGHTEVAQVLQQAGAR